MKITKLMLLIVSSSALCAQDGTGNKPEFTGLTDYCITNVRAHHDTKNDKEKNDSNQLRTYEKYLECMFVIKAQDGTGT